MRLFQSEIMARSTAGEEQTARIRKGFVDALHKREKEETKAMERTRVLRELRLAQKQNEAETKAEAAELGKPRKTRSKR